MNPRIFPTHLFDKHGNPVKEENVIFNGEKYFRIY